MLGTELGRLYNHYYEITPEGNFEGKSIPNLVRRLPPAESEKELGEARERLFHAREQRVQDCDQRAGRRQKREAVFRRGSVARGSLGTDRHPP